MSEPVQRLGDVMALLAAVEKPAELHDDLKGHVHKSQAFGGDMLHHPLVIVPILSPISIPAANKTYEAKVKAAREALAKGDWERYVFLHERPYRFGALEEAVNDGLDDDPTLYWKIVGRVWTDSENIHEHFDAWHELWSREMPGRELAMNDEERAALAALPDEFPIWRGVTHRDAVPGLSWTTDRSRAEWFARRFSSMEGKKPILASGRVRKADVLAHFLGRAEDEIVVLPERVQQVTTQTFRAKKAR